MKKEGFITRGIKRAAERNLNENFGAEIISFHPDEPILSAEERRERTKNSRRRHPSNPFPTDI